MVRFYDLLMSQARHAQPGLLALASATSCLSSQSHRGSEPVTDLKTWLECSQLLQF